MMPKQNTLGSGQTYLNLNLFDTDLDGSNSLLQIECAWTRMSLEKAVLDSSKQFSISETVPRQEIPVISVTNLRAIANCG
jgi:hypothetical protein